MEIRQLQYFLAVAEERSFTRAAARLRVVQSGVSATILALERELNAKLFDRDRQRVALTDAGVALLPKARQTLDAVQAARDAVDEVQGGLRGTVDIGTMISVGIVDLPALLGRFRQRHPAVTVRLRTMTTGTAGLIQAIKDGDLDLAFVSLSGRIPAGLLVRDLAVWPMVLVCPAGHPLAGRTSIELAEIADEPFVDFPVGYGNRSVADQACAAAGIERRVRLEVSDLASAAGFVRHGLGLALLPSFAAPADADLRVLPVADQPMTWKLSVATSRDRRPSAATTALLALVDAHVAVPAGGQP